MKALTNQTQMKLFVKVTNGGWQVIFYLRISKLYVPCFNWVVEIWVEVWENEKCCGNTSGSLLVFPYICNFFKFSQIFMSVSIYVREHFYWGTTVSANSCPQKFDVLKTNIWLRSKASRANMLVLRTSNFHGATIKPIVSRHKHSIVVIVHI